MAELERRVSAVQAKVREMVERCKGCADSDWRYVEKADRHAVKAAYFQTTAKATKSQRRWI